ncbi:hypothetical protein VCHENC02_5111A, partial [Vibrio harveyi]
MLVSSGELLSSFNC